MSAPKTNNAPSSPLRDQAIEYALAGIPIFPCEENGKKPACAHGYKDATDDLDQVTAWWTTNPNFNIGMCPEDIGQFVVDLDPGGEAGWSALLKEHGEHSTTRTVRSPRGGFHYYFKGSLPSTAGKLAPHVDTRGIGGYVLVPPSVVNGKPYEVVNDVDVAPAPAWLGETLGKAKVTRHHDTPANVKLDTEASKTKLRRHLKGLIDQGDVAIEGSGGDARTLALFNELGDRLSLEAAIELVTEPDGWNDHCKPPWNTSGDDSDDIHIVAANAYRYRQNEVGCDADDDEGSPKVTFAGMGAKFEEKFGNRPVNDNSAVNEDRSNRFRSRTLRERYNDPSAEWLYYNIAPRVGVCAAIGDTQAFKSTLLNSVAFSVAGGPPAFGTLTPDVTGQVVLFKGEDDDSVSVHSKAIEKHTGKSLIDLPVHIIDRAIQADDEEQVKEAIAELDRIKASGGPIRLIGLDTLSTMIRGQDENAASTMGMAVEVARMLSKRYGCLVVLVHHRPKSAEKGSANSRGSNLLTTDVEAIWLVERDEAAVRPTSTLTVKKIRRAPIGLQVCVEGHEYVVGKDDKGRPVKALAFVENKTVLEQARRKRGASTGWCNRVLNALEWMRVNELKSCTLRQLYGATARRAEWCDLPHGGKLPLLEFEKLLDRPLTELEAANLRNSARRIRALVQMRKPSEDGKSGGKGPADGRKRNFGTTAIAKLEGSEWVFFPMALAGVNYEGGDDE